jgi:hypothetical protein
MADGGSGPNGALLWSASREELKSGEEDGEGESGCVSSRYGRLMMPCEGPILHKVQSPFYPCIKCIRKIIGLHLKIELA